MALIYVLLALGGYGTIDTPEPDQLLRHLLLPGAVRATGIGWTLGVGRLGGVLGPFVGGLVLASSLGPNWNFYLFGAMALVGALIVTFVPRSPVGDAARTDTPSPVRRPAEVRHVDARPPSACRSPGRRTARP